MTTSNPYRPPAAAVADVTEPYQPVNLFSIAGRIGRARYVVYVFWMYVLIALMNLLLFWATGSSKLYGITTGLEVLALLLTLSIQRAHDCNRNGWFALLALVPVVNLLFLVMPGTNGTNKYGGKTAPNSVALLIVACLTAAIVVSQLAIAAYNAYETQRILRIQ